MHKNLRFLWLVLLLLTANVQAKTAKEIFATVSKSVFTIRTYDANGKELGLGSGVVVAKGEIVTNCHVVKDAALYRVGQGKKYIQATVLYADVERDLCLLIAPDIKAPAVKMGSSTKLQVGDKAYTIGTPEGFELSLGDGLIAQLRSGTQYPIQTTAPISHGSSGGGLFDEKGQLIGITSAGSETGSNIGLAVPVEWIRELRQQKYLALRGAVNSVEEVANQPIKAEKNIEHDWILVESYPEENFFYDKNLILNKDGKVGLYTASDFKKAQKADAISYKSLLSVAILDCKAATVTRVAQFLYANGDLKGEPVDIRDYSESLKADAIADDGVKKLFSIVCGSEKTEATAPPTEENKPNWEAVAKDDEEGNTIHYISANNLERKENTVTLNRLSDYKQKQYAKDYKVYYNSLLTVETYDCKAFTVSIYGIVLYAGNMLSGEAVAGEDYSKKLEISKITDGSPAAIILNRVCGNPTSQATPKVEAKSDNATPDWIQLTKADKTTHFDTYLDKKSISQDEAGIASYHILADFKSTQNVGVANYKSMLSEINFDCKHETKSQNLTAIHLYADAMAKGKLVSFMNLDPVKVMPMGKNERNNMVAMMCK